MIESSLERLAQQILGFDEASLSSLWRKYKERMEQFEPSKEWEKAVIIFFIINAVQVKNNIFNEQVIRQKESRLEKPPKKKPALRLIKS
jgi:hypothetical protein